MKGKFKYLVLALVCIFIFFGTYYFGFALSDVKAENKEKFLTTKVEKGDIKVTASASGNVEASKRKEIKSFDNGIVDTIHVKEGDLVKKGDLLLTFENDSENSSIETTKLDLKREENQLESLKGNLDDLKIYAPQSGYITKVNGKVEDKLSNGFLLTTITNKSICEIPGYFHEKSLEKISLNDKAEVELPSFFKTLEGRVTNIDKTPIAKESGAVLYEVLVEVDNPGGISEATKGWVSIKTGNLKLTSVEETNFKLEKEENINLKTKGTLKTLNVDKGDYIKEGELIAELENSDIKKDIENQMLSIEKKEIQLSNQLEELDETAVYAPISGTITNVFVTEGERINSNMTLITVSDLNNLEVIIPIDELDIINIKENQKALVTAEAIKDTVFNAKVSNIALEGDINNGVTTFDVTLLLNEINGLKPTMTVDGEININSKKDTLLLPIEAIEERQGNKFVLVKDKGSENPVPKTIEIGLVSESFVEITKGLNEGDIVYYMGVSNDTSNEDKKMNMMGIGGPPNRVPGGGVKKRND